MGFVWTDAQRRAITGSVGNILVAAAAGSGKTQVLTQRIIQRIKGGCDVDAMIVVTFTRAAASEMRARIGAALTSALENEPTNAHIKKNLALLSGASICTIDAFCLDVVRQNFFKLDVSPDFTMPDATEADVMRAEALAEVLEECYEKGDEAFLRLASDYGSAKNDKALCEMIEHIYRYAQSFPAPSDFLDSLIANYDDAAARDYIEKEARGALLGAVRLLDEALKYAASTPKYTEAFSHERNEILFMTQIEGYDAFRSAVRGYSFSRLPSVRNQSEDEVRAKELRGAAKDMFLGAAKLLCITAQQCREYTDATRPYIAVLAECAKALDERFYAIKSAKKVLDFSDCEHAALKILGDSDAAEALRTKYEEIYIDEYQDTNALQETLFSRISRERDSAPNMFMVGDAKQGIYSFRQSDLAIFSQKMDTYSTDEDAPRRVIYLSKNFRSRRGIIDGVNALFDRVMIADTGIDYAGAHRLEFGAQYYPIEDEACCEVLLMPHERDESLSALEAQAMTIARKIRAMVDGKYQVYDKDSGEMRPCRYRDFAVLGRSVNNEAITFSSIFAQVGVPLFTDVGSGKGDGSEISTMMALLSVLDNPRQDIALASLLRSPIFGFDENTLLKIRMENRAVSFAAAFFEHDSKKVQAAREAIERWRALSHVMELDKLIWHILDETGYYAFVSAFPDGEARQAALRSLSDAAAAYEKTSRKSLFGFAEYIENRRAKNDLSAKELSEQMNVVRYMSIHKSKGLEFPIVFVFGASKLFNLRSDAASLKLHPRMGAAIDYVDAARRVKFQTVRSVALSKLMRRESVAEEMRLFYVATTRAMEKLFILCDEKSINKKAYLESMPLTLRDVLDVSCFADWLSMSVPQSKFWRINLCEKCSAAAEEERTEGVMEPLAPSDKLRQQMEYEYPHKALHAITSKVSVSELKRDEEAKNLYGDDVQTRRPRFLEEEADKELTGSLRGSAYHKLLSLMDLRRMDVAQQKKRFIESGVMSAAECDAVDDDDILKFLRSPLGRRISAAERVWREESFNIALGADEIYGIKETIPVYVQGVIDCFFFEDDRLVLLDYKTDFYKDKNDIKEKYAKQLLLYEKALKVKFPKTLIEKCLYLFHKHDIIYL